MKVKLKKEGFSDKNSSLLSQKIYFGRNNQNMIQNMKIYVRMKKQQEKKFTRSLWF